MILTMENTLQIQAAFIGLAKHDFYRGFISEDELRTIMNNKILSNLDTDMILNEIIRQKNRNRV